MSLANIEAIIFDLDGTLVDSEFLWKEAELDFANAQLHPKCLEADLDFQMTLLGVTTDSMIEKMKEHYQLEGTVADLVIDLESRVLKKLPSVAALDGSQELLEYVSDSGLKYAIASNSTREQIEASVNPQSWASLIPTRFSVDDVTNGKPAPDLYLYTAKQLGVKPENCIVVEDSITGLMAAKAANMIAFGKPQHDNPNKNEICEAADACFDDLHAILDYIESKYKK